jgi:hypothetical protein
MLKPEVVTLYVWLRLAAQFTSVAASRCMVLGAAERSIRVTEYLMPSHGRSAWIPMQLQATEVPQLLTRA